MNRLKLLAAVALLGIPLAACKEVTPPPPVGSIVGQVSIEGTGIDGVSVNLDNGSSTTTSGGGSYRFDNVDGGTYTVTISGYPSDATFDATSAPATISSAGQSVPVNFSGSYIRTASVMGSVTVENTGLGGVTVALSGVSGSTAVTDDNGQYAFTGLRMGSYSVEISGFDSDEIGFSSTASAVSVGVGESKIVSFDGTYLRTAGIQGQVSIEGEGLEGVNVSLTGGPDGVNETATTDASGQYSFAKLRAGDYAVGISGYDTNDYEFEVTSRNVTVALGETANVPFEGVLLRTSGISGRVSVEGMGLENVTVTLSGGGMEADMTATTDVGGLYAFAGLAAGDYTVVISGQDMDAYVFDATSMDVALGDDETAIVNFEGAHARTASVSGMLFVDEAAKNDAYDEGEHGLPAAGVPVVLVGPGVNDRTPGATDDMGHFAFTGLMAGNYVLVAAITPEVAMALGDYAYGGSATGYDINLDVGEAHTQPLPFDITHTTINFSVSLKSGDMTGDAVPGAMVSLYADPMDKDAIMSATTGDDGMASIRVARAGTSGNTVYATVSTDDYAADADAGVQAVTWDPQMTSAAASNNADIVNLNVDATVSGATVMTDFGGGAALAGWAISVMHGEDAVDGAPAMLDDDGMAALMTTVGAGDLPATFTFAVAGDQANTLDGGEMYDATSVEYTHDGLSLAGTMDAGMMEVAYTTQTLKVYVHHEKDQVHGYTGNILGGDMRMSGKVGVSIRYIDDNGRSRSFTSAEWNQAKAGNFSDKNGVVTFAHVPADANVIVQASDTADGIMLLDPDELAAYQNVDANGISGGAFGANGGFGHTVSLCPLQAVDPTGQDHGECASFAYVTTHTVSGQVWKRGVSIDPASDGFKAGADGMGVRTNVAGVAVSVSPVAGRNLAGGMKSFTTAVTDNTRTPLDERTAFSFGNMASGVYTVGVPNGWRYKIGAEGSETADDGELNPLDGDVMVDVTAATAAIYGRVTGADGFPVAGATVTANSGSATTDALGRYVIDGITPETRRISNVTQSNKIFVQASGEDFSDSMLGILDFASNTVTMHDIDLAGVGATASISGTVRASGTNAPVAGALIMVDGAAPNNAPTSGANKGKLLSGADGSYTAVITAKKLGETASVSATKSGMTFVPASLVAPAHAGAEITGIDFTGFVNATISGRVAAPGGGPLADVEVSATPSGGGDAIVDTTGTTGTFSLNVPFGSYTLMATKANFTFEIPAAYRAAVSVAPGQVVNVGTIQAMTFVGSNVKGIRVINTDSKTGMTTYTDSVKVTWSKGTQPTGHTVTHQVQTMATGGMWEDLGNAVADSVVMLTDGVPNAIGDAAFSVRVLSISTNDTDMTADSIASDPAAVDAVDPMVSGVTAGRDTANADSITVTWKATTNNNSAFRILVQFSDGVWYVAGNGTMLNNNSREWVLNAASDLKVADSWTSVDGTGTKQAQAELAKAFMVKVQSVQGTVSETNPWKDSDAVSVAAKPTS